MDILVEALTGFLCGILFVMAVCFLLSVAGSLSTMLSSLGKLKDAELTRGMYEVMRNWWLQY